MYIRVSLCTLSCTCMCASIYILRPCAERVSARSPRGPAGRGPPLVGYFICCGAMPAAGQTSAVRAGLRVRLCQNTRGGLRARIYQLMRGGILLSRIIDKYKIMV